MRTPTGSAVAAAKGPWPVTVRGRGGTNACRVPTTAGRVSVTTRSGTRPAPGRAVDNVRLGF